MIFNIGEMIEENGATQFHIPLVGSYVELLEEEKRTLMAFSHLSLETEEENIPFDIYLMGGSTRRLALYPTRGEIKSVNEGRESVDLTFCLAYADEKGNQLWIYRKPFALANVLIY